MQEALQSLEIAAENLEVAKEIYLKDREANKTELAEVYLLLGDLHVESGTI